MSTRLMALWEWFDSRMPSVKQEYKKHLAEYYAPKNFNFWYYFGSLALFVLVIQIVSGIWLTMSYKPDAALAFGSVEYIMRDVPGGWVIRYIHSTGSSAFFLVVYLHMFRGMLYGSYKAPRELIWIFGVLIYLCLMGEAFFGYLLPWGQMSYWGAQVIVNLFASVPFIGPDLAVWIRGDYVVSDATLNRFFALHDVGSNNPDGVEIKKVKGPDGKPLDGIPFHPYYTVKDIVGVVVFLAIFCIVMFFAPEMGGYFLEYNNFVPADPLVTPAHIAPVWYFTPYYSILRAIPPLFHSQFPGVLAMGLAVLVLFFLPWLDRSPVKSIRYRGPYYKIALGVFVVTFLVLGYLGTEPTTVWGQFGFDAFFLDTNEIATWVARLGTLLYFLFFILMPWYTARDSVKPVPERVTS
jgi:ubiquinol-cytochrome c reductase cytochrome b subunit